MCDIPNSEGSADVFRLYRSGNERRTDTVDPYAVNFQVGNPNSVMEIDTEASRSTFFIVYIYIYLSLYIYIYIIQCFIVLTLSRPGGGADSARVDFGR